MSAFGPHHLAITAIILILVVTYEQRHVTCWLLQAHPVTSSHRLSPLTVMVVSPPVELRTN